MNKVLGDYYTKSRTNRAFEKTIDYINTPYNLVVDEEGDGANMKILNTGIDEIDYINPIDSTNILYPNDSNNSMDLLKLNT